MQWILHLMHRSSQTLDLPHYSLFSFVRSISQFIRPFLFLLVMFFGTNNKYISLGFIWLYCILRSFRFGNRKKCIWGRERGRKRESKSERNATNSEWCNDHTIDMHWEIESTNKQQQRRRLHNATAMTTTAATTQAEDTHCVCKCDDLKRRDYSHACTHYDDFTITLPNIFVYSFTGVFRFVAVAAVTFVLISVVVASFLYLVFLFLILLLNRTFYILCTSALRAHNFLMLWCFKKKKTLLKAAGDSTIIIAIVAFICYKH